MYLDDTNVMVSFFNRPFMRNIICYCPDKECLLNMDCALSIFALFIKRVDLIRLNITIY